MTKRMLIDASHAEETRVVVMDGNRLEDFDVETASRKQLKGNIYLAKVVRIEPSLQAAFVDYGGNRHGFLAFGEIHPDYYQIPIADRQRLLELQAEQARAEEEAEEAAADAAASPPARREPEGGDAEAAEREAAVELGADLAAGDTLAADAASADAPAALAGSPSASADEAENDGAARGAQPARIGAERISGPEHLTEGTAADDLAAASAEEAGLSETGVEPLESYSVPEAELLAEPAEAREPEEPEVEEAPAPESLGGESDGAEEAHERRIPPRFLRNYKIQEVIRRRQILLVQVVKEERGTKGAALTTYISLAGRYCVLMPNSPRGGGISRKITSPADRRRLKEITAELAIPKGMGLIVRTAGANRPKPEIKRDCEYLLRLWDDIRDTTMRSIAPALIYEEASLIKRAIRDVYSRDIDEVIVEGEDGWRGAHEFMRMLMPTHARKVIRWDDHRQPLFARHQVEAQLEAIMSPVVQLRSGGYLVINQTEALVAIDVNSGRSTRERNVEETALRTDLEAAEEVARQLRLRDLAGLIVVDFIDMELRRHNAMVERRLKEALKSDRARLQVGHISHFGLLEMSRQRLRPSLAETTLVMCPHCGGTGHVRSTESAAIHVLRAIEEEAASRRASEIRVHAAGPTVMYILNHKRERLGEVEQQYAMRVLFEPDDALISPQLRIERLRPPLSIEVPPKVLAETTAPVQAPEPEEAPAAEEAAEAAPESAENEEGLDENERRRRRRRRRRRVPRREEGAVMPEGAEQPDIAEPPGTLAQPEPLIPAQAEAEPAPAEAASEPEQAPSRHRSRRGGRRRRAEPAEPVAPAPAEAPVYSGPTPANPFGGAFDIFDALERVEQAEQAPLAPVAIHTPAPPPAGQPESMAIAVRVIEIAASEPAPTEAEPAEAAASEPEPPAEPAVKPVVIEAAPPAPERKRGWWRR